MNYITEQAKQDKPFFLYFPVPSPHTPILPTKEFAGKSGLDNPYADFVMELDAYVGKLLKQVKEAGIEDNTLIIFTSDNGCSPQANFPQLLTKGHNPSAIYRGTKADIFEGGHRVPFIAKWPNKIKKGSSTSEVICTTDFFATAAALANYKIADNEGEDSYNMMPLFENKKLKAPFREATIHHSIDGNFSIRKGDWKLEMTPSSGGWSNPKPKDTLALKGLPNIQLYNLKTDPSETNNVQASYPEKVLELKNLLKKYITDGRSTPGKPQKNDPINLEWKQLNDIVNN
jgi:arylsulfatase A-like enzyme